MGMWDMPAKHEVTDTELRFNPYHDPTNGRFTTANGGGGSFLYSKGGKSMYVFQAKKNSQSEVDRITSEYIKQSDRRKTTINGIDYFTDEDTGSAVARTISFYRNSGYKSNAMISTANRKLRLDSNTIKSLSDSEFNYALKSKIDLKNKLENISRRNGKDYSFEIGMIDSDIADMKNFRLSNG